LYWSIILLICSPFMLTETEPPGGKGKCEAGVGIAIDVEVSDRAFENGRIVLPGG